MNKLFKLSTAFILIGCFNHSAYSASPIPASVAPPISSAPTATPVVKTPSAVMNNSKVSFIMHGVDGYVPVVGQPNTYQYLPANSKILGETPFVRTLPVGAKLLGQNNNPVPAPIATSIPMPMSPTNPESVQWLPAQYYRFTGPRGNTIYVDDNNGNAYVQFSNGTKNNLSPYPRGQYLMRPPKYQLPGWLLAKWTKNPADNGEYFVAAGNGNSSNRMISKGPDGALQVSYTTQNQWTGHDNVVHQVPAANSAAVNSQPVAAKLVAPASVPAK